MGKNLYINEPMKFKGQLYFTGGREVEGKTQVNKQPGVGGGGEFWS